MLIWDYLFKRTTKSITSYYCCYHHFCFFSIFIKLFIFYCYLLRLFCSVLLLSIIHCFLVSNVYIFLFLAWFFLLMANLGRISSKLCFWTFFSLVSFHAWNYKFGKVSEIIVNYETIFALEINILFSWFFIFPFIWVNFVFNNHPIPNHNTMVSSLIIRFLFCQLKIHKIVSIFWLFSWAQWHLNLRDQVNKTNVGMHVNPILHTYPKLSIALQQRTVPTPRMNKLVPWFCGLWRRLISQCR